MAKAANTSDGDVMRPSSISSTNRDRKAVEELKISLLGATDLTVTNSKVWRAGLRALADLPVETRAKLLSAVEDDRPVRIK